MVVLNLGYALPREASITIRLVRYNVPTLDTKFVLCLYLHFFASTVAIR